MTDFDLAQHHRDKIRRLEKRVDHLVTHRAQLERLLALTSKVAGDATGVEPMLLLSVLEDLDRLAATEGERVAA